MPLCGISSDPRLQSTSQMGMISPLHPLHLHQLRQRYLTLTEKNSRNYILTAATTTGRGRHTLLQFVILPTVHCPLSSLAQPPEARQVGGFAEMCRM